jgi:DNA repair protein RadC
MRIKTTKQRRPGKAAGNNSSAGMATVSLILTRETPCERVGDSEMVHRLWQREVAPSPWFDANKEVMVVFALNTHYRLVFWNLVSIGTLNATISHPREILRPVIIAGAFAFIVAHNHPSGNCSPSSADYDITKRMVICSMLMQIPMLDHIIIGERACYSFKARTKLLDHWISMPKAAATVRQWTRRQAYRLQVVKGRGAKK